MKIVFITDFAAIQQESKSCINLYSMTRKCIQQILIYLKQTNPNRNPIEVGFKCCESRVKYEIPLDLANKSQQFHAFTNAQDIIKQFSIEYKTTHTAREARKNKNGEIHNLSTPILSASRSRSYSRTNTSHTPTSSMRFSLRNQSGLSRIIIALSECLKQYKWSETLINNTNIDDDTVEKQFIFILSIIPNDNSINQISEWEKTIKEICKKSIIINYIHIPSDFKNSIIPFVGNDITNINKINCMDKCLKKLSYQSIGVIPLTLLWISPVLCIHYEFIEMFKINKSNLFYQNKIYQQSENMFVKWNGNICIIQTEKQTHKYSLRSNNNNKILINCDLISIKEKENKNKIN
eukprot:412734_1